MSFKSIEDAVTQMTMDVFGQDSIYTPVGGTPVTISGVFNIAWVDTLNQMSLKPTLRIHLGDLAAPPGKGDQVVVNSINYLIIEHRPDSFGGTTLILQKV